MIHIARNRLSPIAAGILALAGMGALGAAPASAADPLVGSWSGGGRMVLPSGDTERASCRATIQQASGSSFAMRAVCATPSGRVAQTAQLRRVGANEYAGSFYNAEYDVNGSVHISLRGNQLSASLNGGGASGRLSMRR